MINLELKQIRSSRIRRRRRRKVKKNENSRITNVRAHTHTQKRERERERERDASPRKWEQKKRNYKIYKRPKVHDGEGMPDCCGNWFEFRLERVNCRVHMIQFESSFRNNVILFKF